jgi:hypothetical protein
MEDDKVRPGYVEDTEFLEAASMETDEAVLRKICRSHRNEIRKEMDNE